MTTEPGPQEPGGTAVAKPRWLYAGLVASLAMNVLLIGGVGAAVWRHGHMGGGMGRGKDFGLTGFIKDLPPERQPIVAADVAKARETLRPLRRALREAWSESSAALTADPFDKEKLRAAMARLVEAETRLRTVIATAVGDTAEKLTASERRALQAWREQRRARMFGHHGHDGGGPHDGSGSGERRPGGDDAE
jgi:uncharacterized membrane protein